MTPALKQSNARRTMVGGGTEKVSADTWLRDNVDRVVAMEAAFEAAEVLDSRRRLSIHIYKGNGVCLAARAVKRLRADDSYRTVPCCSGSDS